jgi:hypothetical protein
MHNWPTDPMRQQHRFVAAMCDDLLETGILSLDGPRATRVAEISRQINRGTDGCKAPVGEQNE